MDYVSIEVHNEFAARIKEENDRQNHRLANLEQGQAQIGELIASVRVLAVNIENMAKEISKQGDRLTEIESKPGKRWETVVACVISCIVTGIVTGFVAHFL